MVAKDHDLLVAEIAHQPLTFREIKCEALEVVVRDATVEHHRVLIGVGEPVLQRRHRHARLGVGVHDAHRVLSGEVDGAVDGVAGAVNLVWGVVENVPVDIDLHEVGRRDLVPPKAKGIQQEMVIGPRNPRRDVVVDQRCRPAVQVSQPIGGSEVDSCPPFVLADLAAQR